MHDEVYLEWVPNDPESFDGKLMVLTNSGNGKNLSVGYSKENKYFYSEIDGKVVSTYYRTLNDGYLYGIVLGENSSVRVGIVDEDGYIHY